MSCISLLFHLTASSMVFPPEVCSMLMGSERDAAISTSKENKPSWEDTLPPIEFIHPFLDHKGLATLKLASQQSHNLLREEFPTDRHYYRYGFLRLDSAFTEKEIRKLIQHRVSSFDLREIRNLTLMQALDKDFVQSLHWLRTMGLYDSIRAYRLFNHISQTIQEDNDLWHDKSFMLLACMLINEGFTDSQIIRVSNMNKLKLFHDSIHLLRFYELSFEDLLELVGKFDSKASISSLLKKVSFEDGLGYFSRKTGRELMGHVRLLTNQSWLSKYCPRRLKT